MRLIDADRLLTERMKSKYYHLPNGDTAIPLIDIEHAPTVGTGSWIPDGMIIGRWRILSGNYVTPGGTPIYVCGKCGGSEHLHGAEYPRKKIVCDKCGRVNIYPWERSYDEDSSLWENDELNREEQHEKMLNQ